jgi:hypothetical protein
VPLLSDGINTISIVIQAKSSCMESQGMEQEAAALGILAKR